MLVVTCHTRHKHAGNRGVTERHEQKQDHNRLSTYFTTHLLCLLFAFPPLPLPLQPQLRLFLPGDGHLDGVRKDRPPILRGGHARRELAQGKARDGHTRVRGLK
jgi:hypothetical protein